MPALRGCSNMLDIMNVRFDNYYQGYTSTSSNIINLAAPVFHSSIINHQSERRLERLAADKALEACGFLGIFA